MVVGDGVGDDRGIDHQLAHPIAFRLLEAQQMALGTPDGVLQGLEMAGKGGGFDGRFTRSPSKPPDVVGIH